MKKILSILLLFSANIYAAELLIFGGYNHDVFLGCLTCSEYNSDSICNNYGTYGNKYSDKGMFNEFAVFGNEYSSMSPWNRYSVSDEVPVLVDRDGDFYGYFTINEYKYNAVNFSGEMSSWFYQYDGDLEKVRVRLCNYFGFSG